MASVQDRYSRSVTSSHLEVTEFVGDVDALIAAGWLRDSLATSLWRLRVEYDQVDDRQLAPLQPEQPPDRFAGDTEQARADRAEWVKAEQQRIADDFKARRMVARALALLQLRSLTPAKDALGRFVMAEATRKGLNLTSAEEMAMAGRILNAFLDPNCKTCHGVKFKVIPGTGRLSPIPCDACDGSGRERLRFTGNTTDAEVRFTRHVLALIDGKIDHVAKVMGRFLRQNA